MKRTNTDNQNGPDVPFEVASIYGAKTQRGLVEMQLGDRKVQMPIGKAREIRDMLTDAIEAAISDELLVRFLTEKVGLDPMKAAAALMDFRELRQGTRGTQRVDG